MDATLISNLSAAVYVWLMDFELMLFYSAFKKKMLEENEVQVASVLVWCGYPYAYVAMIRAKTTNFLRENKDCMDLVSFVSGCVVL